VYLSGVAWIRHIIKDDQNFACIAWYPQIKFTTVRYWTHILLVHVHGLAKNKE